MKRYTAILTAAALCMTFSSCGYGGDDTDDDVSETIVTQWDGDAPLNILNADFRNIVWGMDKVETERQEQRRSDGQGEDYLFYDNVSFAGFDGRLYYYYNENLECTSAAYIISLSPDDPSYDSAYGRTDDFLTELFVPPDEEGGNIRTMPSAVIELTMTDTDIERMISVKFSMPEGYADKKHSSKVIYFEDGEPVGSSAFP